MPGSRADGGSVERDAATGSRRIVDVEELRRRNPNAVAMDVLYLFTTAFFARLLVEGFWPAVIAAVPLAVLLYFGWRSTGRFFLAQIVVVAATVVATEAGVVPL